MTPADLAEKHAPRLVDMTTFALILGVSRETLRKGGIDGRYPPPDIPSKRRGQPHQWRESTVLEVAARRRGQRPMALLAGLDRLVRGNEPGRWWR